MIYLPVLGLALTAFWFVLSGHLEPLFLGFAAFSVLASLWLCARLMIIDRDSAPYVRLPQLVVHAVWLAGQVLKANIAVMGAILASRPPIPALGRVKAITQADLGVAIFANSITLTPGTVTLDVENGVLLVHGLRAQDLTETAFEAANRHAARAADGAA